MSRQPLVDPVGRVHSIETAGTSDGPGVRFVVFLSGCPLRCVYCHNPDSQHLADGKKRTASDVLAELRKYVPMLRAAKGGLTISGGEPLVQPEFTLALLKGARKLGLHTALDTSGFLNANASEELLDAVDLVLLDIKAFSEETHRKLTRVPLAPILDFARRLAARKQRVWLRYVLVPGWTDKLEEIDGLAAFAASLGNIERVDVLPFHKLGEWKWEKLKRPYLLRDTQPPSLKLQIEVRRRFRKLGLNTPGTRHPPKAT
ncbi:MAG: pyruvate formate lyase-activating protein [Myxococcaceae bacterium]|nr:pyruvate formate lyase-activating protein [Myxococcaceae bacterium]